MDFNKIVAGMKKEGNSNATATETAVNKLVAETLDKIIAGAKIASEAIGDASDLVGNVADTNGAGATGIGVENLVKGIRGIVEVVLKDKGNAEAGNDKKASDGSTARAANGGNDEAGKLFVAANAVVGDAANAKKVAADATKAVGAVTGADILKAMVKDGIEGATNAAKANAKDGTISGAIALRAMAKNGKFAGPSAADNDYAPALKGAATSAVIKALDTLTVAIRSTIDEGLKTIKEAMKININDIPVASDKSDSGS